MCNRATIKYGELVLSYAFWFSWNFKVLLYISTLTGIFFSILNFSGFVVVSGITVMAVHYFFFSTKKIKKLKCNINQNQLTSGHFPGTPALIPCSPFLSFLWFYAGIPEPGMPALFCQIPGKRRWHE
jgi:hypothetical protein